jgi:hypothetical protein
VFALSPEARVIVTVPSDCVAESKLTIFARLSIAAWRSSLRAEELPGLRASIVTICLLYSAMEESRSFASARVESSLAFSSF